MAQREASERMSESGAARQPDGSEPFKRWTAKRKAAVVLDLIKGKTTPAEVARRHDVTVGEVEKWLETFSQAGEEALRANPRDVVERFEAEGIEIPFPQHDIHIRTDATQPVSENASSSETPSPNGHVNE